MLLNQPFFELFRILLELLHLLVPQLVELVKFQHVRLLDLQPLRQLLRAQIISTLLNLLRLDFINPVLGHLSFYVLALLFTFLAVLVQDLNELINVRLGGLELGRLRI